VEYLRRKVFGFKDSFKTLQEAQVYLLCRVTELNKRPGTNLYNNSSAEKLELERKDLYTHPGRMECFEGENLKVDKYSTICFGTNRYSVPDHMVGKMVFTKIYSQWIKIYDSNSVLCYHARLYDRYGWLIDLNHYLITLRCKPGAVVGSIALQQAPEWVRTMYSNHFLHDSKSFIELLQYCQQNDIGSQQLCNCVNILSRQCTDSVSAIHVMALLGNRQQEIPLVKEGPDPIALQAMENLIQLEAMMNYN